VFKNVFQIAYVTNDLRRAVSDFQTHQGVNQLAIFDDFALEVPGDRQAVINVALGYVGDVQLEIIEPVSGEVDLYRSWLPDEYALRHHHFCHRLDSIEELEAAQHKYEQDGYPIALEARLGETRLFYADTTKLLDHYQEYAWISAESDAFMATLPRN
jgi:catechol 2,3-dioxygenase-like lactoylglutathione lyase family enzyme